MENCLFCKIIRGEIKSYKVAEDDCTYSFLDISQATPGHTLVIPKVHCSNMLDCDDLVIGKVNQAAKSIALLLENKLGASGFNIVTNVHAAGGQSVFHYHLHIIPRYGPGDGYIPPQITKKASDTELAETLRKINT